MLNRTLSPIGENTTARVHIRWMIRRDLDEVLRISAATPEPWDEGRFLAELRKRNVIGMVAEHEGRIVGYMAYELHKARLVLLTLAVCPSHFGRGVGRQLVAKLAGKLSAYRRTEMIVDVRETRMDVLRFCRAVGMRATGVIRGHFDDTGEDAFTMQLGCDAA